MTCVLIGRLKWSGGRDREGYREYKLESQVKAGPLDGPANVMQTPGLPVPGSVWRIDDDADDWAFCKLDSQVTSYYDREECLWWRVEQTFSTKPDQARCKTEQVDDPLLRPPQISGSFKGDKEEATRDRFNRSITTSSHEAIRGPQVEFDKGRLTVRIEQNVPDLQLPLIGAMQDTVNDSTLWGYPARCIKLTIPSWEEKYYGQCFKYYSRTLEFEVNVKMAKDLVGSADEPPISSGWDRDILDEGTKVLHGHWGSGGHWVLDPIGFDVDGSPISPDQRNASHFDRFKDRSGENAKCPLNGSGLPAGIVTTSAEAFLALGPGNSGAPFNSPYPSGQWLLLLSGVDGIDTWDVDISNALFDGHYEAGQLVVRSGTVYACIDGANLNGAAPPSPGWQAVGTFPPGLTDLGDYDAGTNYSIGDVVHDTYTTHAGSIRVEKFDESNFLLLNIPTSLT